jgi:basic amino acid/polyamine antiporter, APA family
MEKNLSTADVFAISIGALFSSGFFLLPGLAAAEAGPAVVLCYFLAGLIMLPSLLCLLELATAMPREGGAYYFLDRGFGPLAGIAAGLSTWLLLVIKSGFSLIGMGAYLRLWFDWRIEVVAVFLAIFFGGINIVGSAKSSMVERILVGVLLAVLTLFLIQGVANLFDIGLTRVAETQFTPFAPMGVLGILKTVGMVFVAYAGFVATVGAAEEVKDPDKSLPRGTLWALGLATAIYVVGVGAMVGSLDPQALREDKTPVATAGVAFMEWLPGDLGVGLIVLAAIAAFASTANAGILGGSRYPLAMARDRKLPAILGRMKKGGTPYIAIMLTTAFVIALVLLVDAENVARLGSATQLVLLIGVNASLIMIRKARLKNYAPGFKVPLYPYTPIAGIILSSLLLLFVGVAQIIFLGAVLVLSIIGYRLYLRTEQPHAGALQIVRGEPAKDLEEELAQIVKEKSSSLGED